MTYYLTAAIAGVGGTAFMTGFVYLMAYITRREFKVVKILGTLITNRTHRDRSTDGSWSTIIVGLIAHYLIGVFFAVIYAWLWERGIGSPALGSSLLFGALNGLFAMGFWYSFLKIHPNTPLIKLPDYLFVIGAGHLFFSTGTALSFSILS